MSLLEALELWNRTEGESLLRFTPGEPLLKLQFKNASQR